MDLEPLHWMEMGIDLKGRREEGCVDAWKIAGNNSRDSPQ